MRPVRPVSRPAPVTLVPRSLVTRPLVLAHRGARRRAPENTIEAFAVARDLGADGIELDVRRTADGVLVLHHDPGPADGPVLAMVAHAEVAARFPAIPTLEAALDVAAGLLVNVEIKNLPWEPDFDPDESVAEAVVAQVRGRGATDRVLVSSFHLPTIDRVHERAPELPTAYLFMVGTDLAAVVDLAVEHGHEALHPDVRALADAAGADFVARAHERGLAVNVWTVNDPAEIARMADLGVDAIVTDVPDVAFQVLGR